MIEEKLKEAANLLQSVFPAEEGWGLGIVVFNPHNNRIVGAGNMPTSMLRVMLQGYIDGQNKVVDSGTFTTEDKQ